MRRIVVFALVLNAALLGVIAHQLVAIAGGGPVATQNGDTNGEYARVPMIVRVPGLTRDGTKSDALVELVDMFPTLVELCGIKGPSELQGKSLVPLLKDPSAKGRSAAYTVVSRGKALGRSIRTQRWRYAEWGSADQAELYDLVNDPHEDNNLASKPHFAEQRRQMHALLTETRKRAESKRK